MRQHDPRARRRLARLLEHPRGWWCAFVLGDEPAPCSALRRESADRCRAAGVDFRVHEPEADDLPALAATLLAPGRTGVDWVIADGPGPESLWRRATLAFAVELEALGVDAGERRRSGLVIEGPAAWAELFAQAAPGFVERAACTLFADDPEPAETEPDPPAESGDWLGDVREGLSELLGGLSQTALGRAAQRLSAAGGSATLAARYQQRIERGARARGDGDWPEAARIYEQAIELAEQWERLGDGLAGQRALAQAWRLRGEALLRDCQFDSAAAALARGLELSQALVKRQADDWSERQLAAVHEHLAEVSLRVGDLDEAARHGRRAWHYSRAMLSGARQELQRSRGFSGALTYGDVLLRRREYDTARRAYEDALAHAETLHDDGHAASLCHERLGALAEQLDDYDEAVRHVRTSLGLARQRFRARPRPQEREDLAAACRELGGALARRGDVDEAEQCGREALELQLETHAAPLGPAARYQRRLACQLLGGLALRRRDLAEAERLFAQLQTWAPADSGDERLTGLYGDWHLGRVCERRGRLAEAEARAATVCETLTAEPTETQRSYRALLAAVYGLRSSVCRHRRDYAAARRWADEAHAGFQSLADDEPGPEVPTFLWGSFERYGDLARLTGDLVEADRWHRLNYDLASRAARQPHGQWRHYSLSATAANLGEVCLLRGELDEAQRLYEQAQTLASAEFARCPEPDRRELLAGAERGLALVLHRRGDWPSAQAHFDRAVDLREPLANNPDDALAQLELAELLRDYATCLHAVGQSDEAHGLRDCALALCQALPREFDSLSAELAGLFEAPTPSVPAAPPDTAT